MRKSILGVVVQAVTVAMIALAAAGAQAQECPRDLAAAQDTVEMIDVSIPLGAALEALRAEQKSAVREIQVLLEESRGFLARAKQFRCLEAAARDHERTIAAALAKVALAFALAADQVFLDAGMEHRH